MFVDFDLKGLNYYQKLNDNEHHFLPSKLTPLSYILVEILGCDFNADDKMDIQMEHVAYSVIPILNNEGFIMSGVYSVPLADGAVSPSLFRNYSEKSAFDLYEGFLKEKALSKNKNIMIRIKDGQRKENFLRKHDFERISDNLLPKGKEANYQLGTVIK